MIQELKQRVRDKLAVCELRSVQEVYGADAAVLIPILERHREAHFLLTLRTDQVATHKGQVSFPGGVREKVDSSLEQTAIRETEEEVGITSSYVEIVGRFHEYLAVTRYRVTPFVAVLNGGFLINPNPREVARVLEVPFRFFLETEPEVQVQRRLGRNMAVYFYDYEGVSIWGLTARMIKDFVELLDQPQQ